MKQKLMLKLNKSGYLQIDYAFALLIFLLFIYIISIKYNNYNNSVYDSTIQNQKIFMSRDICQLLISNSGLPMSWDGNISKFEMIGLKNNNNNNFLNSTKINYYNNLSNYQVISSSISKDYLIKINIIGLLSNITYLNFGGNISNNIFIDTNYICYSNLNSEIVKIEVEVLN